MVTVCYTFVTNCSSMHVLEQFVCYAFVASDINVIDAMLAQFHVGAGIVTPLICCKNLSMTLRKPSTACHCQ